jgi:cell division protein FtsB
MELPKLRRRRSPRPWVHRTMIFVAVVVLVDAVFGEQGLADGLRARRLLGVVTDQLTDLRVENARLRDEIRRLQRDPRAIEDLAREELGLIRPGEILVVLRDR